MFCRKEAFLSVRERRGNASFDDTSKKLFVNKAAFKKQGLVLVDLIYLNGFNRSVLINCNPNNLF